MNILFIAILILSIFVLIYFYQEKLLFLNGRKLKRDFKYDFPNKFEEIFIKTNDENLINALHFKLENPKGIVLFCHGNNGNLTKWGNRVAYLLDYNYEVLVFDYRNYGKSTGNFNEKEMYNDALLVYQYLKNIYNENEIVVYGFSLGATFASKIASKNNPKHLILEAPFYNLKKATQFYSELAPTFLLKYQFRTDKDITNVKSPITIFHGNDDKVTSFEASKSLFELNSSIKNEFIEIKEGTHHNLRTCNLYQLKLKEILE